MDGMSGLGMECQCATTAKHFVVRVRGKDQDCAGPGNRRGMVWNDFCLADVHGLHEIVERNGIAARRRAEAGTLPSRRSASHSFQK